MRPAGPRASKRREPISEIPLAVVGCIAVFLLVHAGQVFLSVEADLAILLRFAFIPARWTVGWDPAQLESVLREAAQAGYAPEAGAWVARHVLGERALWSALTYTVLHGSWTHVLVNGIWFAVFATPIARRCGSWRLILLGVAAGAGGAAAHWLAHPLSLAPMIGASAVVSGLTAGAARFMFAPGRDLVQDPEGFRPPHLRARQSLPALARNRQAAAFLGLWFATNLLFGLAAQPLGVVDASIAWEAHIGGFAVGLLLFPAFDPKPPPAASE
jgi:membrane associated rhomboid family serine protease